MRYLSIALTSLFVSNLALAQNVAPPVATPKPGQILVSGTVPDEASKQSALSKLQELYGADRVVDQISVGSVVSPANWNGYVQKLIGPSLKQVSRGQLKIDGNTVTINGEVSNEAQRQQIASEIAGNLNPTYTVKNGLRVSASEQNILDQTLANRTIEFESGQATLTPSGMRILDEMSAALLKVKDKKVEVIGHTDNQGLRARNVSLSKARADAVKDYLAQKGINPDSIVTSGQGPDRPIMTNDTADGRSRNRRIEFRVSQ
ncbi:OmpA family protein [Collimonas sp. OK412]|jgi:OOP family OmpA-OmpF porin|uniref:OmpA family protein n=1 Tax=Collimonas sp. (strain OK412) TaxID=1801619 RepID=UPI0008EFA31B|nr:OmpA family protein [Collimonas sp. OK412]SFC32731.1 OmpA-OmpF porin, OOP family [Collimonas sp. OK412]